MSGRSNDISNQYQYLYRLDMGELETLLKLHNVECSITGNISFEELRTLIKSIPGTQG